MIEPKIPWGSIQPGTDTQKLMGTDVAKPREPGPAEDYPDTENPRVAVEKPFRITGTANGGND